VDLSGALIVTTPQSVALADAIRGVAMFQRLNVPLLGLVENMAYYELPDGTKDYVFGEGGGKDVADRFETPLLVQLPLQTSLRKSGDQGLPAALGADNMAVAFGSLADQVISSLDVTPSLDPL
jgi:ATP-binding protein involved in chromosome partitioning